MPRRSRAAERAEHQRRQAAERQERWRETHAGQYERIGFTLPPGTKEKLQRIAERGGHTSITELIIAIAES